MPLNESTLRTVALQFTSGQPELVRSALERYFTSDVEFQHPLVCVRGRDTLARLLAVTGWLLKMQPEVQTVLVEKDHAVMRVVQHVGVPNLWPGPFLWVDVPINVWLDFRTCEDGQVRIWRQVDDYSLDVLLAASPLGKLYTGRVRPWVGWGLGYVLSAGENLLARWQHTHHVHTQ